MLDDNDFALASAVDTSVVVLEELSLHPQPEVREAVARNPNTPTEVLLKLGKEFPDAITANPIFNLLLLENPESHFVRLSLARSTTTSESAIAIINFIEGKPGTSIDLLEQLASDRQASVRLLVAAHLSTPAKVLEKLAQDTDEDVPFKAASNPNATSTVLEFFAELLVKQRQRVSLSNQDRYLRSAVQLLERSDITLKVLENLLQMNEYAVVSAIASSLRTAPTMLLALTEYQASSSVHIIFLLNLAENPNTPSDALEKLFLKINQTQHCNTINGLGAIAAHPNTPVHLLEQFAVHSQGYLRAKVATNVNIPISILERLSNDSDTRVSTIAKQALKARA